MSLEHIPLHKLQDIVSNLKLNLSGHVVITEAASGPYIVTPVLAAMGGANRVIAKSKTTRYGSYDDIRASTLALANHFGVLDKIEIVENFTSEHLSSATLVTNAGHVRPLDHKFLSSLSADTVISLMYEDWEYRAEDIDLNFCKTNNLKVATTIETHPLVDVFGYLGDMALKQIFDSGSTPHNNTFILLCNNPFGPYIARTLAPVVHRLGLICPANDRAQYPIASNITWLSDFPRVEAHALFANTEAIVFTAYPFDQDWIANDLDITPHSLKASFGDQVKLLRYCGDVNLEHVSASGLKFFPEYVSSGHMGVLPSAVGFDPIIRLQAAGLKVGELAAKGETSFDDKPLVNFL